MSFLQVQQSLVSHRKTLRLARLLSLDRYAVCGRLVALWAWCLDNAIDGQLGSDIDPDILADVMGWDEATHGKPGVLVDSLITAGFLDVELSEQGQPALHIHDWYEHMGQLIEAREKARSQAAERQRRHRAKLAADGDTDRDDSAGPQGSSQTHDVAVTHPSRECHADVTTYSRVENSNVTSESDLRERERAQPSDMAADAALALVAPAPQSSSSPAKRPKPTKVTPITGARVRDAVWDACIAAMGAAPTNSVERGKWAKGIKALKESLSPPCADGSPGPHITSEVAAEIGVRATRYRARYGTSVPLNPMALAGNWTTLAFDIPTTQERQQRQEGNRYGHAAGSSTYGRRDSGQRSANGKPAFGSPEYYAQSAPSTSRAAHVG